MMWRKRKCFWRGCWCLRGYVFHGKSGRSCQKNCKYPNNSHRSGFFLPTTSHLVSSVIFGLKIKTCHALLWTLGTILTLLCPKPPWLPIVHLLWIEQQHTAPERSYSVHPYWKRTNLIPIKNYFCHYIFSVLEV